MWGGGVQNESQVKLKSMFSIKYIELKYTPISYLRGSHLKMTSMYYIHTFNIFLEDLHIICGERPDDHACMVNNI